MFVRAGYALSARFQHLSPHPFQNQTSMVNIFTTTVQPFYILLYFEAKTNREQAMRIGERES